MYEGVFVCLFVWMLCMCLGVAPSFAQLIVPSVDGTVATFDCRVKGQPMPEVTWYEDGVAIPPNTPGFIITQDTSDGSCRLKVTTQIVFSHFVIATIAAKYNNWLLVRFQKLHNHFIQIMLIRRFPGAIHGSYMMSYIS